MQRISSGYGSRPGGGGFETFSWYFFRISGVVLIILAILHLYLVHISTDVGCTSYQFVAHRYANPYWRLYDWLLLSLALLHGMNGLRVVIDDYTQRRGLRLTLQSVLGVLTLVFFLMGTLTIVNFQPVAAALQGAACIHP